MYLVGISFVNEIMLGLCMVDFISGWFVVM